MPCDYFYNGEWISEEQLRQVFDSQGDVLLQAEQSEGSKASNETLGKIKEFLKRINVNIQQLDTKRYNGVNGIAELLHQTIQIAEGKENVALTEEAMHFAVELLRSRNDILYKQMMNKIRQYDIYLSTRELYKDNKQYQNPDGSPNIIKLKEEAIGKLLAEYYIQSEESTTEKPELLKQTQSWWQQLISFIKGLIGIANFNPFESAVKELADISEYKTTDEGRIKTLATKIVAKGEEYEDETYLSKELNNLYDDRQYRKIVSALAQQLEEPSSRQRVVRAFLADDDQLADEILALEKTFYQKEDNPFSEFDSKIKQFNLRKIDDHPTSDEDNESSHYEITMNGETKKIDRTTEWAKDANLKNTGGKDYFKNATPQEKKQWERKALEGTAGHLAIEGIINSALNEDGSLKSIGSYTIPEQTLLNKNIYNKLSSFFIGTQDNPGYLYTNFPMGTKFRTEQQILNNTIKTKRGPRAGTIDLIAITPEGKYIIKDWKFMGFSLKSNMDIPKSKQSQHALQLGDYKRTLKEAYGVKDIEAETVPIHVEYFMDDENLPVMKSIAIGKANIKEEDRTYLLPVVPEGQSSGNAKIDQLITKLKSYYEDLYKKKVPDEKRIERDRDAKQLSSAIRNLQARLEFEPLALEARNFEANAEQFIANMPRTANLSLEDAKKISSQIIDLKMAADIYADIEQYFIDEYGFDNLDPRSQKILDNLRQTSRKAKETSDTLQHRLETIWAKEAFKQQTGSILSAELQAKNILDKVTEPSSVGIATVTTLSKIHDNAKSKLADRVRRNVDSFMSLLQKAGGNSIYSKIVKGDKNQLIEKNSTKFKADINQAKEQHNSKFFRDALNYEEYNTITGEYIFNQLKLIEDKEKNGVYSIDPEQNKRTAQFYRTKLDNSLNLDSPTFDGFEDRMFNKFFWSNLKEDKSQLSDEYNKLTEPERAVYDWIWEFNKKSFKAGYLTERKYLQFLPFIPATALQKLTQAGDKLESIRKQFKDIHLSRANEDVQMGIDPKTGKQRVSVPTYFTSTDREHEELSKDLGRIMSQYIRAEMEFELNTDLEDVFLSLMEIEKNKGHLEKDRSSGRIVTEGDQPKEFEGNQINSQFLEDYGNDLIYAISENNDGIFDQAANKVLKGTEEEKTQTKTNLKKIIRGMNSYVQQLAVGMKPFLITVPNYMGAHFQAIVNAGRQYKGREYEKNHAKLLSSTLPTNVRGAVDMFIPMNEDVAQLSRRKFLWKNNKLDSLKTWSFQDFMMRPNQLADKVHEFTNAATIIENTMVRDGKFVNIREYLQNQPEYKNRYNDPSTIKEKEAQFEKDVQKLKETDSLPKIGKFDEEGYFTIPNMDMEKSNYGEYRTKIIELGRNITSQMSSEEKFAARRDILAKSFLMFKNWIIKQSQLRALDIHFNAKTENWEYGRMRLYTKLIFQYTKANIFKIRAIRQATPEGIAIMKDLLENKRREYKLKTGQDLTITDEEFFDLVRKELTSETKELRLLLSLAGILIWSYIAQPPEDEDKLTKNRYKLTARVISKVADELRFYYNPLSFESMTRGSLLPSLGVLTKTEKVIEHFSKESWGQITGNEDLTEKSHPLKYTLDMIPIFSQFDKELLPIISPSMAQDLGIKPTAEARIAQ